MLHSSSTAPVYRAVLCEVGILFWVQSYGWWKEAVMNIAIPLQRLQNILPEVSSENSPMWEGCLLMFWAIVRQSLQWPGWEKWIPWFSLSLAPDQAEMHLVSMFSMHCNSKQWHFSIESCMIYCIGPDQDTLTGLIQITSLPKPFHTNSSMPLCNPADKILTT